MGVSTENFGHLITDSHISGFFSNENISFRGAETTSYVFLLIALGIWLTAHHRVDSRWCLVGQGEGWPEGQLWGIATGGQVYSLRNGSESSRPSWTRRFYLARGLIWGQDLNEVSTCASSTSWGTQCTCSVTIVPIIMLAYETLETKQPEGKASLWVMEGKAGATNRLAQPILQGGRGIGQMLPGHPFRFTEVCSDALIQGKEVPDGRKGTKHRNHAFQKGQAWARGSELVGTNIYPIHLS